MNELDTHEQAQREFETIVKPVIEYLAKNHHPHMSIVIDSTRAELLEGQMMVATNEFLVD